MARSMLAFGMLTAFAEVSAERSRGFASGSAPPILAATMISLAIREKALPLTLSAASFLCLIFAHLL